MDLEDLAALSSTSKTMRASLNQNWKSIFEENLGELEEADLISYLPGQEETPENIDWNDTFLDTFSHVVERNKTTALKNQNLDLWLRSPLRDRLLVGADFSNSDLTKFNFSYADLSRAKFTNSDLKNARLFSAILKKADFKEVSLVKADLGYSFLRGADFTNAILSGARLPYSDYDGANFTGTDLRGADYKFFVGEPMPITLDMLRKNDAV